MDKFREKFDPLIFPEGSIAFHGNVQVDDYGADEFRIELIGRPPLFGEWEQLFHANGNDFDVQISSFGYVSPHNVGNMHPGARAIFSIQERSAIEKLIIGIFEREFSKLKSGDREASIFPGRKSNYCGDVIFKDNWIRVPS
jgi:hypothetical protein